MSDLYPKFIIETTDELGDCLIISKCSYHKQLAYDISKIKSGGWWNLKDNTFILKGESHEFGKAKLDDIKKCIENGNVFTNYTLTNSIVDKYNFKYDDGCEIIFIK
jgi:hypothetical protein